MEEKILEAEVAEKNNDDAEKQVLFDKLRKINFTDELLDDDSYSSLLRETVKEIVVFDDRLKIVLVDGVSFELPRIPLKRKAKGVPFSSAVMFIAPDASGKQTNYHNAINFYASTEEGAKPRGLVKNRLYRVLVWQ